MMLFPQFTPPAFNAMIKPPDAICNLNCQYCYFLKKENLTQGPVGQAIHR